MEILIYIKEERFQTLEEAVEGKDISASRGIGHTRWATHGPPNDKNAHPHISESGDLAVVHNGIIENYDTLKQELENKGYTFRSDTDTEVLSYLISDIKEKTGISLPNLLGSHFNKLLVLTP